MYSAIVVCLLALSINLETHIMHDVIFFKDSHFWVFKYTTIF